MPAGEEAQLSFRNVRKAFAERAPVLTDFSVDLPLSGVTFVVGRSGAGKSVVCRLAVGLLKPDGGLVRALGQPVETLSQRRLLALRRELPYLVQSPALLDHLSVGQNVQLTAGDPDAARAALARVGLADAFDRPVTALSPAAQKRVAIARALALRPRCLLLDEPTTGLDRAATRQVNAALAALKALGLGAIVVSHDYRSLEQLADRVLVVSEGRAAFLGTAREFFASSDPALQALIADEG